MNGTVKDIMTTHVVAVRKAASFKDMAFSLREHRVSAFPVLDDDNRVIGVVSEADLLAKEALEDSSAGLVAGVLDHREQAKAAGITAADQVDAERARRMLALSGHQPEAKHVVEHVNVLFEPRRQVTRLVRSDLPQRNPLNLPDRRHNAQPKPSHAK